MSNDEKLEFLNINDSLYQTRISNKFKNRKGYKPIDPKKVISFIPGTILEINVEPGQVVQKGEIMMILDAMKMKNKLISAIDGKIKSIEVNKGDRVSKGALLIEME
jgi:biotin carboxyl carrier protein